MADEGTGPIAREDIESLAEKLDAFAAGLTEGERRARARVIATAAVATEGGSGSVEGYAFSSPLALNLGRAASLDLSPSGPDVGVINPGKIRAKDVNLFQGFERR
jgi:hypothetical protein